MIFTNKQLALILAVIVRYFAKYFQNSVWEIANDFLEWLDE